MRRRFFSPGCPRNVRQITLVAKKVVDDQYASRVDRLRNRLVTTKGLLVEREGKRRINRFGRGSIVQVHLMNLLRHLLLRIVGHGDRFNYRRPCFVLCLNSGILVPAPARAIASRTLPTKRLRTRAVKALLRPSATLSACNNMRCQELSSSSA